MPRPISWLCRLHEIRRSVKNSVRSHYERKDIEALFQIQPRAAQVLVQGICPSAKIGRSFLVARNDLERFLDRIYEGAEPRSLLSQRRVRPRRRLRELVQVDHVPASLEIIPSDISLHLGRVSIDFTSMEELSRALLALAEILDDADQFANFECQYVPLRPASEDLQKDRAEVAKLFAELEALERQKRG